MSKLHVRREDVPLYNILRGRANSKRWWIILVLDPNEKDWNEARRECKETKRPNTVRCVPINFYSEDGDYLPVLALCVPKRVMSKAKTLAFFNTAGDQDMLECLRNTDGALLCRPGQEARCRLLMEFCSGEFS
jgi:hypothetical protein